MRTKFNHKKRTPQPQWTVEPIRPEAPVALLRAAYQRILELEAQLAAARSRMERSIN